MRGYTVYRVNYATKEKVAIGSLLDRRRKERRKNLMELLREARRLFASDLSEAFYIVLDSPGNAKDPGMMAMGQGFANIASSSQEFELEDIAHEPVQGAR